MQALTLLQKFFSVDMVIYAAIVLVAATALARCTMPLSRVAARLRRAARTIVTESKQNKEKKSWNDMHFLGDSLSATWADFLQNAEMRDAHGETCDVTQYINEDTVIYALGRTGFAGLAPGVMTSLGILGTFLGLVMGLSGLSLTGADTEVVLTAMDQLIRGMSTAFLTSIAACAARCCSTLLNNRATDKCQKAIDRFCEVFSLYAMPKPVSEDTAMLALQQEQTAYIRQAVEDMSQKMAVQMEQSIMRAMLPVQRSMDNFILAATQAQVEGVDRIAQVFVQRMNVALGNEFDHLRQVLAETGVEQQKTQQELRAATEAIGQMTQDVVNMHQLSQGVLEHFAPMWRIWTHPARRWTTPTARPSSCWRRWARPAASRRSIWPNCRSIRRRSPRPPSSTRRGRIASSPARRSRRASPARRWIASSARCTRAAGRSPALTSSSPSRRRRIWRVRPRCLTRASLPPSTSSTRRWIPCAI
ncbi:MAG: hypothetical protein ACLS6G_08915 [Christensenellales bacterium]